MSRGAYVAVTCPLVVICPLVGVSVYSLGASGVPVVQSSELSVLFFSPGHATSMGAAYEYERRRAPLPSTESSAPTVPDDATSQGFHVRMIQPYGKSVPVVKDRSVPVVKDRSVAGSCVKGDGVPVAKGAPNHTDIVSNATSSPTTFRSVQAMGGRYGTGRPVQVMSGNRGVVQATGGAKQVGSEDGDAPLYYEDEV